VPYDPDEESVFRAGQVVPAGVYARLDSAPERRVVLGEEGVLPASFDGRVALYHRIGDGRPHRVPVLARRAHRRSDRRTAASA
jgi:hypothetical protein